MRYQIRHAIVKYAADTILEERYWTKKDMQDSWGADQYSKYYMRHWHGRKTANRLSETDQF